ncbi:MAG: ATP-binding protein [Solirubrobacterales bacterium]|nr:ATP-binding protein [Solirubrobacterales bacterium]
MYATSLGHERLSLRLPVRPSSVGIGRRAAAQFAEEVTLADPTPWRVRVAVSEAISNVVLHAHPDRSGSVPHFLLLAESDPVGCAISIIDEGVGLRSHEDSPGMGFGLALIARSCDELNLDTGPQGGTCVRMTFHRS